MVRRLEFHVCGRCGLPTRLGGYVYVRGEYFHRKCLRISKGKRGGL